MGPAQDDPVLTRHHVQEIIREQDVVDLWLREEHTELPLDRDQLLIAEERLGPEPCAVQDDRLRERHNLLHGRKLLHDQPPSGREKVAEYRAEVNGRLHEHAHEALDVSCTERIDRQCGRRERTEPRTRASGGPRRTPSTETIGRRRCWRSCSEEGPERRWSRSPRAAAAGERSRDPPPHTPRPQQPVAPSVELRRPRVEPYPTRASPRRRRAHSYG